MIVVLADGYLHNERMYCSSVAKTCAAVSGTGNTATIHEIHNSHPDNAANSSEGSLVLVAN